MSKPEISNTTLEPTALLRRWNAGSENPRNFWMEWYSLTKDNIPMFLFNVIISIPCYLSIVEVSRSKKSNQVTFIIFSLFISIVVIVGPQEPKLSPKLFCCLSLYTKLYEMLHDQLLCTAELGGSVYVLWNFWKCRPYLKSVDKDLSGMCCSSWALWIL